MKTLSSKITIHWKHSIRDNKTSAIALSLFKFQLQIIHVHMVEYKAFSFCQPNSINYRGVIKLIGDDSVFVSYKTLIIQFEVLKNRELTC